MTVHTQFADDAEMTDNPLSGDPDTARDGSVGRSDVEPEATTALDERDERAPETRPRGARPQPAREVRASRPAAPASRPAAPASRPAAPASHPAARASRPAAPARRPAAPARRPAIVTATRLQRARESPRSPSASAAAAHAATGRRIVALLALLLLPVTVVALAKAGGPEVAMSSADAQFLSRQLVVADQRVRARLVHVRDEGTARSLARTRDALLTTRSLAVEMRSRRGPAVVRLQAALAQERAWLDAVGSTLANPRSPLRDELPARDAQARRALATLPTAPAHRVGGARSLISYARSRETAGTG
ncbi:MAG: hypothetical protein QOJ89_4133 [bacterium]